MLLLASCGEEELSIDDSKEVSETVTSASKAVENGDLDLMLIQDESVIFPQSQGVYDFHENELTIVKQYLPMADLEDSSASASDVALYKGQIESDFQRHFPIQRYSCPTILIKFMRSPIKMPHTSSKENV